MRLFSKVKDGGPESPVNAYFLFELKSFGSIALLRFNKGTREAFHTHAFNALTWFLLGSMEEEIFKGSSKKYKVSFIPKLTKRTDNHRVKADKTSWAVTIRGPWAETWTEDTPDKTTVFAHGRRIVEEKNK